MLHVERSGQHGIYLQPYEQWFLFQHLWEPKQQHHFRPGQRNGHRGHDRGHGTGVPAENYTVGAGPYHAPVAAVRLSEHLRQAGGVFPQVYVLQLPRHQPVQRQLLQQRDPHLRQRDLCRSGERHRQEQQHHCAQRRGTTGRGRPVYP